MTRSAALFLLALPLAAQDPGATSSIKLLSGTVGGYTLSPNNRTILAAPGASISGSIVVQLNSTFGSSAVMSVAATPNWGSHKTSYQDLGHFTSPVTGLSKTVSINLTAPSQPGTYYYIVAFRGEFTAAQVMSSTNWTVGSDSWDDGDDIADWSANTIRTAISKGTVQIPIKYPGSELPIFCPATAIAIVVGTDPGKTSTLRLVSGNINGQALSSANRTVTVPVGGTITGSFDVRIYSEFASNAVMALGATPNWGSHATSFIDGGNFPTPVAGLLRTIPVNLPAPVVPGTYYIIAAYRGEFSASQVMSATNWAVGPEVWNNGDDVADWSDAQVQAAIANGTVLADYYYGAPSQYVPATAVKIVVQ